MFHAVNPINGGPPTIFVPSFLTTPWVGAGIPAVGAAAANTAYYLPFNPMKDCGISAVTINCGTANGNVDVGVYTYDGTLLASRGATAAVSGNMTWTPTNPIAVSGGVSYWIAMSASSATATWCRYPGTTVVTYQSGLLIQASAHPLPATATFAVGGAATMVPIFEIDFV